MQQTPAPRSISQQHTLGCGVACVAWRCGLDYSSAHLLFTEPSFAWMRGYYCAEIVEALARGGWKYTFKPFNKLTDSALLQTIGTIVFIEPGSLYPAGHYLVRTPKGWMNSWLNFPQIIPLESGFEPRLPGIPQFVIHATT